MDLHQPPKIQYIFTAVICFRQVLLYGISKQIRTGNIRKICAQYKKKSLSSWASNHKIYMLGDSTDML